MAKDLRGRYEIYENPDPTMAGEFDWYLESPDEDPPNSQFQLSEAARATYGHNSDFTRDGRKYEAFRTRLREIVRLGLCESPLDPTMPKRLSELDRDILISYQDEQTPIISRVARSRLFMAACTCGAGVLLRWFSSKDTQVARFSEWLLFACAACAALAFVIWTESLKSFDDGPKLAIKLREPMVDFAISLVIVLAAGAVLEAGYLSVQISNAPLKITAGAANALALGFLLGLLNERLMDSIFRPIMARLSKSAEPQRPSIASPRKKR